MRKRSTEAAVSFYDDLAPRYDAEMAVQHNAEQYRHAFQTLVARHLGPGQRILDFGCGTGIDAAAYVSWGHDVLAYDVSPGMLAELKRRCRAFIEAGRIVPVSGDLDALLGALVDGAPVNALTSNFAVVNQVEELDAMFGAVFERAPACRWVFLSVQNPTYPHDMRKGWWWRGMVRGLRRGAVVFDGGPVPTYRWRIGRLRRAFGEVVVLRDQWSIVRGGLRRRSPGNRLGSLRLLAFERILR